MTGETLAILLPLFLVVGALYASVGHAGASGYLAVMAMLSIAPEAMRPTALSINVLVAAIAFAQFARAGHFRWRLFWPFALSSMPAAYLGGRLALPTHALKVSIGVVLLFTAARMAWIGLRASKPGAGPGAGSTNEFRPPATWGALLIGAAIGIVSGITGTGGGIFLSPLLILLRWSDTKRTAAVASLFVLVNSLAGLAGLAHSGWTPGPELAWMALAAGVGGAAGSWFGSRRAPSRVQNVLLACVLVVAGIKLVTT
ncbi:MAG: sulfite exporter TauE/SafE family protein [Phycisphaerae bacterium]|nr:sulfite exporter TauE/SafE family protein [Phycisphaerae bacterium]